MAESILTERLLLRPASKEDAAPLHRVLSDPIAMRWWSSPPHRTLGETEKWIAAMIQNDGLGLDLVVEFGGDVIGKAGFWKPPEIGYILRADCWGRGLAREACSAVIHRLFERTNHPAATADVDPENLGSIALLRRLGFRQTGSAKRTWLIAEEWKDSLYFALQRRDWPGHGEA